VSKLSRAAIRTVRTTAARSPAPYRDAISRAPRIQPPGTFFHVGSKGNNGRRIYADDFERRIFLMLLTKHVKRHDWILLTHVLMTNHFHLLLQLRRPSLSDGMCGLNGEFSRFTSARHRREPGHLFRNRFWSEPIQDDAHLQAIARYIVLNPVRAGICRSPEEWPWSSYRAVAGLEFMPAFLAGEELLKHFGKAADAAREDYRSFVRAGVEDARNFRHGARHRDGSRTR
jgi:REP element-mobilizing transposase RayT